MSIKKVCLYGLLSVMILLVGSVSVWANGAFTEPDEDGNFIGPELWAVVVIHCGGTNVSTIRIKRINNCNVETWAYYGGISLCPADISDAENVTLDINPWGLRPASGLTVITKVKNFLVDGTVVSFDAQLNFWQPN